MCSPALGEVGMDERGGWGVMGLIGVLMGLTGRPLHTSPGPYQRMSVTSVTSFVIRTWFGTWGIENVHVGCH